MKRFVTFNQLLKICIYIPAILFSLQAAEISLTKNKNKQNQIIKHKKEL